MISGLTIGGPWDGIGHSTKCCSFLLGRKLEAVVDAVELMIDFEATVGLGIRMLFQRIFFVYMLGIDLRSRGGGHSFRRLGYGKERKWGGKPISHADVIYIE